ncbi:NepR family anti-sigma factor [Teichococcus aestuarii]
MLAEPATKPNRSAAGRARKGAPDAAFDLWLQRGLHAMYDDVAKEPIPEELLRLIEQDRAQGPKK